MSSPGRILILHRDQQLLEDLVPALKEMGHLWEALEGVAGVLEAVQRERIDLAFFDIAQVSANGFSIVAEVKRRQPKLVVALLTHDAKDLPLLAQAVQAGVVDFVPVEADLYPVVQCVRRILGAGQRPVISGEPAARRVERLETWLADAVNQATALESTFQTRRREFETELFYLQDQLAACERQLEAAQAPTAEQRAGAAGTLGEEWKQLEARSSALKAREDRLRAEAVRLSRLSEQIAVERLHWHQDLARLHEQDRNLADYEQFLRNMQAEMDRTQAARKTDASFLLNGAAVTEASKRLDWANALLARERVAFNEEREAFREREAALAQLAETLAGREAALQAREEIMNDREAGLAAEDSRSPIAVPAGVGARAGSGFLSRAPFVFRRPVPART